MIRFLSEQKTIAALPPLAAVAGREVYPLSRTAARAVAAIVGSTDQDEITDRLKRDDLPEASAPQALSEGVSRALWPQERHSPRSSHERRRKLTQQNAAAPLPDASGSSLRPESPKARQQRLRTLITASGRDPARCGNCDAVGPAKVGHVVPTSRGGSDLPGNLVVLCTSCRRKLPSRRRDAFDDGRRRSAPIAEGGGQLDLFRAT
jgi:5-methylcytosine-specific restriction endonuclease McrA